MKPAARIPIDIRELFRSGRFDCLRIGQTKELILSNFPEPDDIGGSRSDRASAETSPIWRYGNIELHFDGPRLQSIFSDYVDALDGGESLAIDPWILGEPDALSLPQVMSALNGERIDFTKTTRVYGELEMVTLALASGVVLQFNKRDPGMRSFEQAEGSVEDQNELQLGSFSLGS